MRVNHQHKDGQQPTKGWSPTNLRLVMQKKKFTTDLKCGTYTLLTKLTPHEHCHGWSHTILKMAPNHPRMVTNQPKDGHPNK